MENTGGDASWVNRKNERHNRSINNMVWSGFIDSNQHANKWFCAADTSAEVHRGKLHNALDNTLPRLAWYGQKPSIYENRNFRCDIYPITLYAKKLYYRTQAESLMGYTNIWSTMKCWYPQTKKVRYCLFANFYEYKNKFGKWWSTGSELMLGTNTSTLTTSKIDLSDHTFIKNDIFEVDVNLSPGGTPIGIVRKYCKHHNMSYIYQSTNNSSCINSFIDRNRTSVCILSIGIK